MPVFVDTSALLALADWSDSHHQEAATLLRSLELVERSLITSDYILDEIITRLRLTLGHAPAVAFVQAILSSRLYSIVGVDENVWRLAWERFKKYSDQDFSFTDFTSFVIMNALKLDTAFAFDHHFKKVGLKTMPS